MLNFKLKFKSMFENQKLKIKFQLLKNCSPKRLTVTINVWCAEPKYVARELDLLFLIVVASLIGYFNIFSNIIEIFFFC